MKNIHSFILVGGLAGQLVGYAQNATPVPSQPVLGNPLAPAAGRTITSGPATEVTGQKRMTTFSPAQGTIVPLIRHEAVATSTTAVSTTAISGATIDSLLSPVAGGSTTIARTSNQALAPALPNAQAAQNRDSLIQALGNNRDTLNANLARNNSAIGNTSLGQALPFSSTVGGSATTNSFLFQNVSTGTSIVPSNDAIPPSRSVVATNVITSTNQLPGFGR